MVSFQPSTSSLSLSLVLTILCEVTTHSTDLCQGVTVNTASMATSRSPLRPPNSRSEFEIAIICALPMERDTVEALMTRHCKDEGRYYGKVKHDDNTYTLGELGSKPVVLVAPRDVGTTNTRQLATSLRISFPNILYAFVVGIAGAAPFIYKGDKWAPSDIQLGDVVISTQVIEYDFGKTYDNGFRRKTDVENALPRAPADVANFVNVFSCGHSAAYRRVLRKTNSDIAQHDGLQEETYKHPGPDRDNVFPLTYRHKHQDPTTCTIMQCVYRVVPRGLRRSPGRKL
jgi:nucleoside phosphorylase